MNNLNTKKKKIRKKQSKIQRKKNKGKTGKPLITSTRTQKRTGKVEG